MKSFVKLVAISALVSLLPFGIGMRAAQADSYTFNNVGDTALVSFSNPNAPPSLTGTVSYTVSAISDTSITFNVTVANTSTTGTATGIVATGFQTTAPAITTLSITNNNINPVFTQALSDVNAPGGFNTVELCVANGGNCPSANPPRLNEGASETFALTLNSVANGSNQFVMTTSFIRFAGELGSFTFGGGPGQTLPVPASLPLVGAGMIAWSLARRLTRQ